MVVGSGVLAQGEGQQGQQRSPGEIVQVAAKRVGGQLGLEAGGPPAQRFGAVARAVAVAQQLTRDRLAALPGTGPASRPCSS